jgi:hypothetical protein
MATSTRLYAVNLDEIAQAIIAGGRSTHDTRAGSHGEW